MFDFEDYKQLVLEIIWDGKHINRFVCELRLTLFVNALNVVKERPQCLMPFPHYFFNPKSKTNDIDGLNEHIELLPPLKDIKEESKFPLLTWKLLHWIFTNPLNIKPLYESDNQQTLIERLERLSNETKLSDIPYFRFRYNHVSHFEIITPHPKACSFASDSKLWKHSQLIPTSNASKLKVKCIAIVEVVDDPSINWPQVKNTAAQSTDDLWLQRKNSYCCVVDSDHLMQLSYLIVLVY